MDKSIKIRTKNIFFSYQNNRVLNDISVEFREHTLTAIVGPSGIGKSTFLMTLNRLWEGIPGAVMKGNVEIRFDGAFQDIYLPSYSPTNLRRSVGMVFQIPNPLPMSIYRNVAFPLKLAGFKKKDHIDNKVEEALTRAYLWDEVRDRLRDDAFTLSGGQQQRLCIARTLIMEPQVLLLDEPTSSLDAESGRIIEELLISLKERCTLLVVSHYREQVKRIADTVLEISDGHFIPGDAIPASQGIVE
jgi:phosphate transport system ATP-binding protein